MNVERQGPGNPTYLVRNARTAGPEQKVVEVFGFPVGFVFAASEMERCLRQRGSAAHRRQRPYRSSERAEPRVQGRCRMPRRRQII